MMTDEEAFEALSDWFDDMEDMEPDDQIAILRAAKDQIDRWITDIEGDSEEDEEG